MSMTQLAIAENDPKFFAMLRDLAKDLIAAPSKPTIWQYRFLDFAQDDLPQMAKSLEDLSKIDGYELVTITQLSDGRLLSVLKRPA